MKKLYVTMLDMSPLEWECPPRRRVVEIILTPEQEAQLKPRRHATGHAEYVEIVESCVLEEAKEP